MLVSLKLIFIHSMATSQKSSHSLVSNVKVCEKGLVTLHVRFKKATTHTLSVLAQTETVPIMSCLQVVSSTSFQVQMSKYEFMYIVSHATLQNGKIHFGILLHFRLPAWGQYFWLILNFRLHVLQNLYLQLNFRLPQNFRKLTFGIILNFRLLGVQRKPLLGYVMLGCSKGPHWGFGEQSPC